MAKLTLLLACLTLGLFGTTKSVSFECRFKTNYWGTLGIVYHCDVQNSVSITSPNEGQIDSISGTHLAGYNNDNVRVFKIAMGQIHYFPRGLDKIYINLIGIQISSTGLKEIHQSDLKAFPKLRNIYLCHSDLEILEENLFEFNPNLEMIGLYVNKIFHIDPNVFDKLTKLTSLKLHSNICININAVGSPSEVQNIYQAVKSQCINSDYVKLKQNVSNLENESNNLSWEEFKENLKPLENEAKNSKFLEFFKHKIKALKIIQTEKAQEEVPEKLGKLVEELTVISGKLKENEKKHQQNQNKIEENLSAVSNKIQSNQQLSANLKNYVDGKVEEVKAEILKNNQKIEELDQHITKGDEAASKFSKDTTTTLKDIEASNSQTLAAIMKFIENLSKKMEAIEEKLAGIDSTQKKVMNKIHKIESDSLNNKIEINQKLKAILHGT